MNQYPLWKYLAIFGVIFFCAFYALPNLFGEDPAVQISPAYARDIEITPDVLDKAEAKLKEANLTYLRAEKSPKQLLLRFKDNDTQLKAYSILKEAMPDYVVAQNLASATPAWLTAIGAQPMYLGLDLRGGVHFLMQVDMETALRQDEERLIDELRTQLRTEKVRYKGINRVVEGERGIDITFSDDASRLQAKQLIVKQRAGELIITEKNKLDEYLLHLTFSETVLLEKNKGAIEQNITTLNNRINELGVAEPVIQQQGSGRIVVQLPGIQDTARAKEILGATATLEFRLTEGTQQEWFEAEKSGKIPPNARLYHRRGGDPVLLKRSVIVTGDQINDAAATMDQQTGQPVTAVSLDSKGAKRMDDNTKVNVGNLMAVVFIEYKVETKKGADGKEVTTRQKKEEVINVATIQERFSHRFQITGLTTNEARNLALLLRAGALRAPMEIVEERTVGPSLGKENIIKGLYSSLLAFLCVIIFMWLRYSTFGLVANFALLMNVVVLVALMSLLQATLTLPGIAGMVLILGMAVDANVLIYERMREEIRNGNSPQASIHAGFERAFITIFDSNLTTLLAGLFLFGFGSGPVRGFAVTLSLGIATSMFTAIWVSRAVINYFYGGKKLERLPV
jgi:preprotein translocase subunit SecD